MPKPLSSNPLNSDRDTAHDTVDERFMRLALQLAQRGEGHVEPNPMVGCVIVRDGNVIGEGFHRKFGGPHAEVDALDSLGADAKGATAFVSLEPCCHHGKTPPCSQALIDAGIARVVVAMEDPFPKVDGGGLRQLSQAGIDTTVGVLRGEVESLCAPYLKKVHTKRPWVIAKWAMTVDGKIATATGRSQWITSPASRTEVHRLRGRVDAIMVGMGTVEADDPMLTARLKEFQSPPRIATRVVFCRERLPSVDSKLVKSAKDAPLLLVVGSQIETDRLAPLEEKGATVLKANSGDPIEIVQAALDAMGKNEITNVMVEGGGELLASFVAADEIDECHVYIGAKIFGGRESPGPIGGPGVRELVDARVMKLVSVDQIDDDLRVIYRRADH